MNNIKPTCEVNITWLCSCFQLIEQSVDDNVKKWFGKAPCIRNFMFRQISSLYGVCLSHSIIVFQNMAAIVELNKNNNFKLIDVPLSHKRARGKVLKFG